MRKWMRKRRNFWSKLMALLLAVVITGSMGATAWPVNVEATGSITGVGNMQFSDVQDNTKYYYNAVYWAAEYKITYGTGHGKFSPEESVTRGQMITFVYRYYQNKAKSGTNKYGTDQKYPNPFADVVSSDYYGTPVTWAYANGITKGTSSDRFSPSDKVTRAQMITFLYRASCKFAGTDENMYKGRPSFDDVNASKWYGAAACWSRENDVAKGVAPGKFDPNGFCTRGQGVTFLNRAHNKHLMSNDDGNGSDDIGSATVAYFEDGGIFLHGASSSIIFRVRTSQAANPGYHVTDAAGNTVACASVRDSDGSWFIQAPQGGYTAGGDYTLKLDNGTSFTKDIFTQSRYIEFVIAESETAQYDYSDNVEEVDSPISVLSDHQIQLRDGNVRKGSIIIGKDTNGNQVAYRVDSISGNTANVSTPGVEEIFDELEVHGTMPVSAENLTAEDRQDVQNILQNSEAVQTVSETAEDLGLVGSGVNLADKINCTVEQDEEDPTKFVFELSLDLKPDKAEGIRNIELNITAKTTLDVDVITDISLKNQKFDVAFDFTRDDNWKVNVDYKPTNDATDLTDKIKQAMTDSLDASKETDFAEALFSSDDEGDKIGDGNPMLLKHVINYPLPDIPVISVFIDLDAFFDLDLAAQASAEAAQNDGFVVGAKYVAADGSFRPYSDFSSSADLTAMALGKANAKGGLGLQAGLCVIDSDVAHIDVMPKIGAYLDAAASAKSEFSSDTSMTGAAASAYAEVGGYLAADVNAGLRLPESHEYSHTLAEKKFPWKSWGNKKVFTGFTADNASLTVTNGRVQLPAFTASYYDIEKAERSSDHLDASSLTFKDADNHTLTSNDGVLDVSGIQSFPAQIQAIYTDATRGEHKLALTIEGDTNQSADEEKTYGNYKYKINSDSNSVTITKYIGQEENVTIPAEIDGRPVIEIGEGSFSNCKSLSTVQFPDSLETIDTYAFADCDNLQDVQLPEGLKTIGYGAFTSPLITSITIPSTVEELGWLHWGAHPKSSFLMCPNLETVVFADGTTSIPRYALSECENVKDIIIPESVTEIGDAAFLSCGSLKKINLPKGLKEIRVSTFAYCVSLQTVRFPDSLETIDDNAFQDCTSLETVSLFSRVKHIGKKAFSWCTNLRTIQIPQSVTSIGEGAFDDCNKNILTIYGYKNSYAETYAKDNGIAFA